LCAFPRFQFPPPRSSQQAIGPILSLLTVAAKLSPLPTLAGVRPSPVFQYAFPQTHRHFGWVEAAPPTPLPFPIYPRPGPALLTATLVSSCRTPSLSPEGRFRRRGNKYTTLHIPFRPFPSSCVGSSFSTRAQASPPPFRHPALPVKFFLTDLFFS